MARYRLVPLATRPLCRCTGRVINPAPSASVPCAAAVDEEEEEEDGGGGRSTSCPCRSAPATSRSVRVPSGPGTGKRPSCFVGKCIGVCVFIREWILDRLHQGDEARTAGVRHRSSCMTK